MVDKKTEAAVAAATKDAMTKAIGDGALLDKILAALLPQIIEKIIQGIIDRITGGIGGIGGVGPSPIPPVAVLPPAPSVPPPYPPPRPMETHLIAGFTTAFHNWFKGDLEEGKQPGESSSLEAEEIRRGRSPLPPESRIIVDADPQPPDCIEEVFPAFHVTLKDEETGEETREVLTREQPSGALYAIQAADTPTSVYNRSNGHRIILICPAPAHRSSMRFRWITASGKESNEVLIPWCARG